MKDHIEELRQKAKDGDAAAQHALGYKYEKGLGVDQDDKEADKWYLKAAEGYTSAAEQGDIEAQHELGLMYHFGKGVTKNNKKALYWYIKAAAQGCQSSLDRIEQVYRPAPDFTRCDLKSSEDRKVFKPSMSKMDLVVLAMSSLGLALWMVTVSFAILER